MVARALVIVAATCLLSVLVDSACPKTDVDTSNFCRNALETGANVKAEISGALNVSLTAVKYYEQLRGDGPKALDNMIKKAMNSSPENIGKAFVDWFASPEFVAYAQSAGMLALPSAILFVLILLSFIPICCARCCWVCKGEEQGNTCGGCCGPDNCCYPRRSADEYTILGPCGGKALPTFFWVFFAMIALAMACIGVVNSALAVNSISQGVCEMGKLGENMQTFSNELGKKISDIDLATSNAITQAQKYSTDNLGTVSTSLASVKSSTQKFICDTTWDKGSCTDFSPAVPGFKKCDDQYLKCTQYSSVCCIFKDFGGFKGTPQVAINAVEGSGTGLDKTNTDTAKLVDDASSKITPVRDTITKETKTAGDQIKKFTEAIQDMRSKFFDKLGNDLDDATCGLKPTLTVVNQYTYLGASADHALEFLAILFGLIGIVSMYICRPQTDGATYPQVAKVGSHCMRASWVFTVFFMLLYGLIGFLPVFLSIAVGDTCYVIKEMPSDFQGYLGKIIPPFTIKMETETVTVNLISVLQKCYDGAPLADAIPLDKFTDQLDDLNKMFDKASDIPAVTLPPADWDASKDQVKCAVCTVPPAECSDKTCSNQVITSMDKLDTDMRALKDAVNNLKGKDLDDTKVVTGKVKTAILGFKTDVKCKFVTDLYDGLANAMCQNGLEGTLWIALTMVIIGWCGFPMLICAILINIRMGGVGQRGAWTRGLIADMDSAGNGNNLKKDPDNFTEVQMTSGNYNLP